MSEFYVEVVKIGKIEKHPNADTLSITTVKNGYPVILRTGDYQEGDLAAYLPVDSIVPSDDPRWAFLGEKRRIKAKRLRGVFSMGLLTPIETGWVEGQDVREALRVLKYEPPEPAVTGGDNEKDPGFLSAYTDIEGLRRWPDILKEGEEVVLHEKIHGANSRFLFNEGRLWVGSHHCIKAENDEVLWWKVAKANNLAEKLATCPGVAFYGEIYGRVQDLKYGTSGADLYRLAMFDAQDIHTKRYLDYDEFMALAKRLDFVTVPELYRGPWSNDLIKLSNGKTTIEGADHCREGFIVKPIHERFDMLVGRVIFKMVGEDYLLRQES